MKRLVRSYLVGTVVQEKSGRVKLKTSDLDGPKWISRARHNFQQANKKFELTSQHRVFHLDGDVANDDPSNLAAIKFTGYRYSLKHSRVLFTPKAVGKPLKLFTLKKEMAVA